MNILFVAGDQSLLHQATKYLENENEGFTVKPVSSPKKALKLLQKEEFDVIVSSYKMSEINGVELLNRVQEQGKELPFILFTRKKREDTALKALKLGTNRFIRKTDKLETQYELISFAIKEEVQHRRLEKELRQSRVNSWERLNKLRNEFLVMATHEINTPLTPIKSTLEMLQEGYYGDLKEEQSKKIKEALTNVNRLIRLVSQFSQITHLYNTGRELEKHEHQLSDTIEKALKSYDSAIAEKGILLIKKVRKSLTATYDEEMILQVIQNLVENAIDYTKDMIWIKGEEKENQIYLSVRDNGKGIPEEKQEQIFEPFYRVDDNRVRENREFGGAGLGLTLSKRIMKAHNGEIHVESDVGKGSTFTLILPKK